MITSQTSSNYGGASQEAIQHHYDVGNDFYRLWLDETLTYSCALWDGDADDLGRAQRRKLSYLADGALARGAGRVLEVGCGWGGLLRHLVNEYDVQYAVGLTLSTAQADALRGQSDPRIEVRVENWAEHEAEGYDAIISIGAFEHFAQFGLDRSDRLASYREFFRRCHRWLPARGRLAVQTNIKGNNVRVSRETVRELLFIVEKIFPESEIPALADVVTSSERLFDVVSVRNDPDHYARTCAAWHRNLVANRDEAVRLVGESTVADYEYYLSSTVGHFERRHLGLARVVFEKV